MPKFVKKSSYHLRHCEPCACPPLAGSNPRSGIATVAMGSFAMTRERRGSVLIYALILTALLLSSALSLSTLATYGAQTTRRLVDSIPAYYAAESCLEQLLNRYLAVAEPAHVYLSTDTNIPDSSTPRLEVGNTSSFGETATGVKATCTTSATASPSNAPATVNTNSVTLTSYGFFGRSIEGLSATITRFTP